MVVIIGLLGIDFLTVSDSDSFKENILVEAHGVLGDIFIFGIIISIYDTIRINSERKGDKENQKQLQIDRYNEELDDFRGWNESEAMYRNVGNIKRLIRLGEQNLNLCYCNLSEAILIKIELVGASLIEANLKDVKFTSVTFINCVFIGSNLENTLFSSLNMNNANLDMLGSNLYNCNFQQANLRGASFIGAKLSETRLLGADLSMLFVTDKNWIDGLEISSKKYVEDNYVLLDHNLYTSAIFSRNGDKLWSNTFFLVDKTDIEMYKFYNERVDPRATPF